MVVDVIFEKKLDNLGQSIQVVKKGDRDYNVMLCEGDLCDVIKCYNSRAYALKFVRKFEFQELDCEV